MHARNLNFNRKKYQFGQYGILSKEEQYEVNTEHKLTDDLAVNLPMVRKLARHFAQNAADNAIGKFMDLFDETSSGDFDFYAFKAAAEASAVEDAAKRANMTSMDKLKENIQKKDEE